MKNTMTNRAQDFSIGSMMIVAVAVMLAFVVPAPAQSVQRAVFARERVIEHPQDGRTFAYASYVSDTTNGSLDGQESADDPNPTPEDGYLVVTFSGAVRFDNKWDRKPYENGCYIFIAQEGAGVTIGMSRATYKASTANLMVRLCGSTLYFDKGFVE